MDKDWGSKEPSIHIQNIIQMGETFGVTLTTEMLDHLKVIEGENVQVEIKEHELIIRKIVPPESPEDFTENFFQILNESVRKYEVPLKSLKKSIK